MSSIKKINETDESKLRFKDYRLLKCGNDKYSKFPFEYLKQPIKEEVLSKIAERIIGEKNQAVCIRWMLRGLILEKAIRKTLTDLEVKENAIKVKAPKRRLTYADVEMSQDDLDALDFKLGIRK